MPSGGPHKLKRRALPTDRTHLPRIPRRSWLLSTRLLLVKATWRSDCNGCDCGSAPAPFKQAPGSCPCLSPSPPSPQCPCPVFLPGTNSPQCCVPRPLSRISKRPAPSKPPRRPAGWHLHPGSCSHSAISIPSSPCCRGQKAGPVPASSVSPAHGHTWSFLGGPLPRKLCG